MFRRTDTIVKAKGLCDRTIAEIVKSRSKAAGFDPKAFSGHSLRSGFATSASLAGFDSALIARQTGHKTQQALAQYVRPSAMPVGLELKPRPTRDEAAFDRNTGGLVQQAT
jgi:integrase